MAIIYVAYFMDYDGIADISAVFESEAELEEFLESQDGEISYEEAVWGEALEVSAERHEALMQEYGE